MTMSTTRRGALIGAAATVAAATPLRRVRAAGPVRVGVVLPTSGILSAPGQACLRGFQLAEKVAREAGAPPIEFVYADTESKPENGRLAAEKLIRDGCAMLTGAFDSGTTISAIQAAEAAKVPFFVNIAAAPQVTEQGFTQVFRNFPSGATLIRNAIGSINALIAGRSPAPKTAVLMAVNDTFGQSTVAAINALWAPSGIPIQILDTISYDLRARDLSAEVAKAKATGADLVLPVTRVNDAILIVREMVKQDYAPMAIIGPGSPGPYEKPFGDALGKYADEYMTCVPWYNPKTASTLALVERFEKDFPGQRFELNVGFSYEAAQVMADAVRRAGSGEPAAIHAALKATDIAEHLMAGGPIRFDEKGQNPNIGGVLLQNQGGKPVVVGPAEVALAAPKFPMTPWRQR